MNATLNPIGYRSRRIHFNNKVRTRLNKAHEKLMMNRTRRKLNYYNNSSAKILIFKLAMIGIAALGLYLFN